MAKSKGRKQTDSVTYWDNLPPEIKAMYERFRKQNAIIEFEQDLKNIFKEKVKCKN